MMAHLLFFDNDTLRRLSLREEDLSMIASKQSANLSDGQYGTRLSWVVFHIAACISAEESDRANTRYQG